LLLTKLPWLTIHLLLTKLRNSIHMLLTNPFVVNQAAYLNPLVVDHTTLHKVVHTLSNYAKSVLNWSSLQHGPDKDRETLH
jgi:hypothetical protein